MEKRKDRSKHENIRSCNIDMIQVNNAREFHAKTVFERTSMAHSQYIPRTGINADSSFITSKVLPNTTRYNTPNNPPCASCGTIIIPSPKSSLPLEDMPSITIEDWTIKTRKKPILNSSELDEWDVKLDGLTLPEMIFGNNFVRVENMKYNWSIEFNAFDALKLVKLEDTGLRVSYSRKWINSKLLNQLKNKNTSNELSNTSLQIGQHYDWTYTTMYKGTIEGVDFIVDNTAEIPVDKLSNTDPILFYDDMILFEDELADNGISLLNTKIRVMKERLLILNRFFLRVDDVLFKIIDTRVYIEFSENKIIREFKMYQGDYKKLLLLNQLSKPHDPKALMRNSNWVAEHLPLIQRECGIVSL